MALPDLHSAAKFGRAIDAQTVSSTGDVTGQTFDATGYRWVYFMISLGALANAATVKLQSSADGSTWADVAGKTLAVADTDDNTVKVVALDCEANSGPYYRLVWTSSAGTANSVSALACGAWSKDTTAGGAYAPTTVTATW